ncbi:MAG TPA: toxin-antitoxin system HicB family antitoxin [Nocardioidaceae bacterium]|nr:toxin-antitoxin system HicB family antitoxin [Nocardioidaceae bacterium]
MDITTYVETLRADLLRAADALGPESRAAAERLEIALEPSTRMALMEALSDAAAEITQDLPHAAVEVRLKGREPQFVVTATEPEPEMPQAETTESESVEDADDGAVARITVRIPEGLKARAEQAAGDLGQSLNSWIVHAIRRATRSGSINVDVDLGAIPFPPPPPPPPGQPWGGRGRRMKGWAR